jgi:hypothetical protein
LIGETLKRISKTSAKERLVLYELKQHKQWFEKECSRFLHQRKQVKSQWLLDPKQSNIDNLKNVRREASRHFRNKKKEYLKVKTDELKVTLRQKNIRDVINMGLMMLGRQKYTQQDQQYLNQVPLRLSWLLKS